MSEAKHTPGPWYWVGWYLETDAQIVLSCERHDQSTPTRADCRLIAAAPDLLEALRRLLPKPLVGNPSNEELIAFWKRERDLGRAQADDFLAAYAAIAKATGGAA